jgi:hypothetical protein
MKLTREKLKQIIKEELQEMTNEPSLGQSSLTGPDAVLADAPKRQDLLAKMNQINDLLKTARKEDKLALIDQFFELNKELGKLQDQASAQLSAAETARRSKISGV